MNSGILPYPVQQRSRHRAKHFRGRDRPWIDLSQPGHKAQEPETEHEARFGRIDVLVNNAGLLVSKPFIDYTSGDFEALVSTILAGFFYISQSAAKQMLHQQSGHIVNISTSVVDQPIAGVPCALQVLAKGGLQDRKSVV